MQLQSLVGSKNIEEGTHHVTYGPLRLCLDTECCCNGLWWIPVQSNYERL